MSRHQYRNDERFLWYRCHNSGSPLQVGAAPDFSDLVFRICLASAGSPPARASPAYFVDGTRLVVIVDPGEIFVLPTFYKGFFAFPVSPLS